MGSVHATPDPGSSRPGDAGTRIVRRDIVSSPARVIQIERLRISDEQRSSVGSALRAGRGSGGDRSA